MNHLPLFILAFLFEQQLNVSILMIQSDVVFSFKTSILNYFARSSSAVNH